MDQIRVYSHKIRGLVEYTGNTLDIYDDINNNAAVNLTVEGFITPLSGAVKGRAAIVASGTESNTNGGGVKFRTKYCWISSIIRTYNTNSVNTRVNSSILSLSKIVNKSYANSKFKIKITYCSNIPYFKRR